MEKDDAIAQLQSIGSDLAASLMLKLGLPVAFAPLDPRETLRRWYELLDEIGA